MKRKSIAKAFTLIELMVVVAIIALLISILLPSLGQAREAARRAKCLANLKGFSSTLRIYASAYGEKMPAVGQGANLTNDSGSGTTLDTQASLWKLITLKLTSPDVFLCPSDTRNTVAFNGQLSKDPANPTPPFTECDSQGIAIGTTGANGNGYRCWSYSYQVPQDDNGRIDTDNPNASRFAIMADRAPYAPEMLTLVPAGNADTRAHAETWLQGQTPAIQVIVNSPNHSGAGENVLYQDGHAAWSASPFCGIRDDNIYTKAGANWDTTASDRIAGTAPATPLNKGSGPTSDDDSLLCNFLFGTARDKTHIGGT